MKKLTILTTIAASLILSACHPSAQKETTTDDAVLQKTPGISTATDSVMVCKGYLIMGHEAYSFTPEKDTVTYWVIDRSEELKKHYEAALPVNAKPYTPVPAELKIKKLGPSDEGFASEYDGVIEIHEIIHVGK